MFIDAASTTRALQRGLPKGRTGALASSLSAASYVPDFLETPPTPAIARESGNADSPAKRTLITLSPHIARPAHAQRP